MKGTLNPCIFEYIYLSRPDSVLNNISVYEFQLSLGRALAKRIKESGLDKDVDMVSPPPVVLHVNPLLAAVSIPTSINRPSNRPTLRKDGGYRC